MILFRLFSVLLICFHFSCDCCFAYREVPVPNPPGSTTPRGQYFYQSDWSVCRLRIKSFRISKKFSDAASRSFYNFQTAGTEQKPIHFAAKNGHVDAVNFLLNFGDSATSRDFDGLYPIHAAAKAGQLKVVESLLAWNKDSANWPLRDKEGFYDEDNPGPKPIHLAARHGHVEVVKLLLDPFYGEGVASLRDIGFRPLYDAIENGQVEVVRLLLDYDSDATLINPNSIWADRFGDRDLNGPVYLAAGASAERRAEVVQVLLSHYGNRAALEARGKNFQTGPLDVALVNGDLSVVKVLIENGAGRGTDLTSHAYQGTALHVAARRGQLDIVKFLLRCFNERERSKKNEYGKQAIEYAVEYGYLEIVKVLVGTGKDAKARARTKMANNEQLIYLVWKNSSGGLIDGPSDHLDSWPEGFRDPPPSLFRKCPIWDFLFKKGAYTEKEANGMWDRWGPAYCVEWGYSRIRHGLDERARQFP